MYSRPHLICVAASAADAAMAMERAPAAAMAMALDRLNLIVRCRDKGTCLTALLPVTEFDVS